MQMWFQVLTTAVHPHFPCFECCLPHTSPNFRSSGLKMSAPKSSQNMKFLQNQTVSCLDVWYTHSSDTISDSYRDFPEKSLKLGNFNDLSCHPLQCPHSRNFSRLDNEYTQRNLRKKVCIKLTKYFKIRPFQELNKVKNLMFF